MAISFLTEKIPTVLMLLSVLHVSKDAEKSFL